MAATMRRLLVVVLGLVVLAASGPADAKAKKSKTKAAGPIQTGDPLPAKAPKNAACHDQDAIRFLGEGPSTPLAVVSKGKIASAGQACCAPWAKKGTRWKTLDAFGRVVGEAEITGGEGYDVTQCYELELSTRKGAPGVGLFVSGDYAPPKSVEWTPTDVDRGALAKLISGVEVATVPTPPIPCSAKAGPLPLAKRALFFTLPKLQDDDGKPSRWAVVGGPVVTVARLQKDGRWVARYIDAFGSDGCLPRAYEPRAVFDADGDGRPEIFLHQDFGDGFGDVVLGLDPLGFEGAWRTVAKGVHGSTA
jgi:hypothetical protein